MRIKYAFLALNLLIVLCHAEDLKSINDFKKNYFKILMTSQGFQQVKTGLEDTKNSTIIFNGFLNHDLYTDLITLSNDKKTLNFHLYNNDKGLFESKVKSF